MKLFSQTLRALAILVAIAAVADPAVTLSRSDRPLIALIAPNAGGSAENFSQALQRDFDVHAGPIAGAAATVIYGDELQPADLVTSGAIVAVIPPPVTPRVEMTRMLAPAAAPSGAAIPVSLSIRAVGMRGRTVTVDLFAGSLAVDSASRAIVKDDDVAEVTLALPPAAAGVLDARAVVRDSADSANHLDAGAAKALERHAAIDVRDQRWRVAIVDRRPSWTSTFIRRALEEDRRVDVVSSAGASKNIEAASGAAPALDDPAALAKFDAVVIGGPDAMTQADARALERYARERGGSIVLLLDQPDISAFAGLGIAPVEDVHGVDRVKIPAASGAMIGSEFAVPRNAAPLAALARAAIRGKDVPVVWQQPLGAGRVVINGALDAWRYRAREHGGFAKFWTDAVGRAAAASPAPLELTGETARARPGERFQLRAVVRDAALSDPSKPAPLVELRGPLTFWPATARGEFTALVQAPETPGSYAVSVTALVAGAAPVSRTYKYVVGAADSRPAPQQLAAWAASRGGRVIEGDAETAASEMRRTVRSTAERAETHPMRSIWWIPVFVALTGGDWWLRRRRGER